MIQSKLKKLNVLIVTHSRTTGFPQMLKDWLVTKVQTLVYIDHPLHVLENSHSFLDVFSNGKKTNSHKIPKLLKFPVTLYIQDFFYTIVLAISAKKKFDIAIGVDNLNTISLLVLKKFGLVKKVVYHTVDYTPVRFKNKLLNKIYHYIDLLSCYHADMIWNSSGRMNNARVKNGLDKKKIVKTIVTPDGSNFDPERMLPINEIDRKRIVFLGHLREGMGLDLILSSFKEVLIKIKDAKLLIIGGGPLLDNLKKSVLNLGISQSVEFTGFIENHEDVDEYIRFGSIGVAPFEPVDGSIEYYSDVGKPKVYLAAGMPVVITKIPEIAFEIAEKKAGIAIDYNKKELTDALVLLLDDDTLYRKYRTNAIELSKKYIWANIFEVAFEQTFRFLNL